MTAIVCACGCGRSFKPKRTTRRFFGPECVLHWKRESGQYSEAGKPGGRKAGAMRRRQVLAMWRAKFPGVPERAAREIYRRGYMSGYELGSQRGYRKGFAAACGEQNEDERRSA